MKPVQRPVYLRNQTTDRKCFEKVFVYDEYRVPFDLSPHLIVDAGANIGMATLYFAHQYPQARIVAIEPELSNFEMLQRNCGGLSNVTLIQSALWPTHSALEIEDSTAAAWTFRVTERSFDRGIKEISAITVPDILERAAATKIDLLKIDIEGSELELFSDGAELWVDHVQAIAIELHDRIRPGCAQAFYSVLTSRNFTQEIRGENVFVMVLGHRE